MSDEFEQTERSRILSLLREEFNFPVVGEVKQVWPHDGQEDRPSNHEVDVGVPPGPNPETTYRRVPVAVPTSGIVATPRKTDKVLLVFRGGTGEKPIVSQVVYGDADADRAPKAAEDVVRVKREPLYAELAGDGTHARLAKKPDDTKPPTAAIEIDDTPAQPTVSVTRGDPVTARVEIAGPGPTIRASDGQDTYGLKLDLSGGTVKLAAADGTGFEVTNDGKVHIYGEVNQHTSSTISF